MFQQLFAQIICKLLKYVFTLPYKTNRDMKLIIKHTKQSPFDNFLKIGAPVFYLVEYGNGLVEPIFSSVHSFTESVITLKNGHEFSRFTGVNLDNNWVIMFSPYEFKKQK